MLNAAFFTGFTVCAVLNGLEESGAIIQITEII